MRQLPSESIDLIYIDPPFFSNRTYNVIWGDKNEERSFNDIWEGGLDGYLIWLNARLYEMKRLLKPTGSIYVHCDWHASHYIKVEMDKIFGYENFRNEIIWAYRKWTNAARFFQRNHDALLMYSKSDRYIFNKQFDPDAPQATKYARGWDRNRVNGIRQLIIYDETKAKAEIEKENYDRLVMRLDTEGTAFADWWDINYLSSGSKERVGYPTQKPESLIARIIRASSNEGDVVADFFGGGGGMAVVAQRLDRHWILCDQSRVAVAVTAERVKSAAQARELDDPDIPDFTIEHWGVYEATRLAEKPESEFRQFVLDCYGNCAPSDDDGDIHAYQGTNPRLPVWVGPASLNSTVSADDVIAFANAIRRMDEYRDGVLHDGVMLAWGFSPNARKQAAELADLDSPNIQLVQLQQITLDSSAFRKHIADLSTERGDYSEFLTFVRQPRIQVNIKRLGPRRYRFDATTTQTSNDDAKIINIQWDFRYNEAAFRAAPGQWFQKSKNKNAVPSLVAEHRFEGTDPRIRVACRIQDDKGGEGMWSKLIDIE